MDYLDLTRFFIYDVFGYRKKVVFDNLRNSFPNKSEQELNKIGRIFYKHFCDLIFESLKCFSISKKSVLKRMKFNNPEVINAFYEKGKSVILVGGHFGNWELFAVGIGLHIKHLPIGLYRPLTNKYFNNKINDSRSKFGLLMLPTRETRQFFQDSQDKLTCTIFGSNQSPSNVGTAHWMEFLNQETGVAIGAEKYSVRYNYPIVFGIIRPAKRGHYEVDFKLLTETPEAMEPGAITEQFTRMLEANIVANPPYWLWTHRRWKRKKPFKDYGLWIMDASKE